MATDDVTLGGVPGAKACVHSAEDGSNFGFNFCLGGHQSQLLPLIEGYDISSMYIRFLNPVITYQQDRKPILGFINFKEDTIMCVQFHRMDGGKPLYIVPWVGVDLGWTLICTMQLAQSISEGVERTIKSILYTNASNA